MRSKDYYQILGVETDADQQQIRKAYRRLALIHHPDKNEGRESAATLFREIQEAYQVLSDPHRRSAYNQKQWYHDHLIRKKPADPLTPYKLFTKVNELKRYVTQLRPADINKHSLSSYVRHLLNERSIHILRQSHDAEANKEIVMSLLEIIVFLAAGDQHSMLITLQPITDSVTMPLLQERLKETNRLIFWEKYRVPLILLITLLLCVMIYLVG